MKNRLLVVVLMVVSQMVYSQCEEQATGFGKNSNVPSYNVAGDVSVNYSSNKVTFKTASNYSTASGPDVRVYLVNSEGKTDQQLINSNPESLPNISFGLVTKFSGEQTISVDVPNGVDLKDYDTVFFFCLEFAQFWDFGKITPINTSNCSLSFNSLTKEDNLKVYPIPVKDVLNIEGNTELLVGYELFNFKGQLIEKSNKVESTIDVSKYPKGVYSLVLYSEKGYEVEKIVLN